MLELQKLLQTQVLLQLMTRVNLKRFQNQASMEILLFLAILPIL